MWPELRRCYRFVWETDASLVNGPGCHLFGSESLAMV
jgi:hypothetical protein